MLSNIKIYVSVWLILMIATIMEVAVRYSLSGFSAVAYGIVAISMTKGVLIALYFQHLRYEKKTVGTLPIMALLALSTLLITAILSVGMGM